MVGLTKVLVKPAQCVNHTHYALTRGLKTGLLTGNILNLAFLRLNLKVVLMENYKAIKLMVGGWPPLHPLDKSLIIYH